MRYQQWIFYVHSRLNTSDSRLNQSNALVEAQPGTENWYFIYLFLSPHRLVVGIYVRLICAAFSH